MIGLEDVRAAARRIEGRILRTPALPSDALSRATGAQVVLKLENLQAIGSFKERGAANKLALLTEDERRRGVVAMSAGNHAQAVARHAGLLGIRAVIVMPLHTPAIKVVRTRAWGAEVVLHGETLAETAAHAFALAERDGPHLRPSLRRPGGHGRPGHARAGDAGGRAGPGRLDRPRGRRRHDRGLRRRGRGR